MQLLVIFVACMGAFALRTVLQEAGGVVLVNGEVKGNGSDISRHVKMQTSEPMDMDVKPARKKFSTWSAEDTKTAKTRIKRAGKKYLNEEAKHLTDRMEVQPFSPLYLGALFENAWAYIKKHKDYRVLVETERSIVKTEREYKKRTNKTYNSTFYKRLSEQHIGLFWNKHYYQTVMPWTNVPLSAELEDRVVNGLTAAPENMDEYFKKNQGEADHEMSVGREGLDDREIARDASEYDGAVLIRNRKDSQKDLAAVDELVGMGFDRVMAAAAYMRSGRNIESAIDLLEDDERRKSMERRKSELADATQNPLPSSPPPGIPFGLQRDDQIQFNSASSLPSLPKTPPGSPQKQIQTPTSVRDPDSPLPGFK